MVLSLAKWMTKWGRLQSLLENLQIDDKTIIWFCNCNGPEEEMSENLLGSTGGLKECDAVVFRRYRSTSICKMAEKYSKSTTNFISSTMGAYDC